jgi:hypothetical protein
MRFNIYYFYLGISAPQKLKKEITMFTKSCFLLFLFFFLIGCTHTIRRNGYTIDKKSNGDCIVEFERGTPVDSTKEKVIGKVKVGDSGFSFACGEDDAIEIFKKEACGAGANIVNIINEKRPDFLSTCYRAEALLIIRTTSDTINNEDNNLRYRTDNDSTSLHLRVERDHKRTAGIMIGSIIAGLLAGLLVSLSLGH